MSKLNSVKAALTENVNFIKSQIKSTDTLIDKDFFNKDFVDAFLDECLIGIDTASDLYIEACDARSIALDESMALVNEHAVIADFHINSVKIIDNCHEDEHGNFQLSQISALIAFEYNDDTFAIDFQTTTTYDYDYSSKLAAYDESDDYNRLAEIVGDDDLLDELLSNVCKFSPAATLREQHIKDSYTITDEEFHGMDANSEANKATKKSVA